MTAAAVGVAQVKICGLKRVDQAAGCAEAGASAVGCVFYPPSPRNVSASQARDIFAALPAGVARVGVFVDEPTDQMLRIAEQCGLTALQLHGRETPETVARLVLAGYRVIKGLYTAKDPRIDRAGDFPGAAFLVECGKGPLPGGNAASWRWGDAREFGETHPLILAGGLSPGNVSEAIAAAQPDAVDVSSGVEAAPGDKDLDKVTAFIAAVHNNHVSRTLRRIF